MTTCRVVLAAVSITTKPRMHPSSKRRRVAEDPQCRRCWAKFTHHFINQLRGQDSSGGGIRRRPHPPSPEVSLTFSRGRSLSGDWREKKTLEGLEELCPRRHRARILKTGWRTLTRWEVETGAAATMEVCTTSRKLTLLSFTFLLGFSGQWGTHFTHLFRVVFLYTKTYTSHTFILYIYIKKC